MIFSRRVKRQKLNVIKISTEVIKLWILKENLKIYEGFQLHQL